jgi:hypothetical protein
MTTGHISVGKAITYNKKKCLADNRTAKYEASGGPVENQVYCTHEPVTVHWLSKLVK